MLAGINLEDGTELDKVLGVLHNPEWVGDSAIAFRR